jgi:hypothetical protein
MLRITVELVPFGEEDEAATIGEVCIANVGGGTAYTGNYEIVGYEQLLSGEVEWIYRKVVGHTRHEGVFQLLKEALRADALGDTSTFLVGDRLKQKIKSLKEKDE